MENNASYNTHEVDTEYTYVVQIIKTVTVNARNERDALNKISRRTYGRVGHTEHKIIGKLKNVEKESI